MTLRLAVRAAALVAATLGVTLLAGCDLIPDPPAVEIPEGETAAFALTIGDCLDDAEVAAEVTSLPIVACTDPHDSEVFAVTESSASEYPGADALEAELTAYCEGEAFAAFVGIPFGPSRYETSGYFPTESSWARGDRELLCTIWDPEGPASGSLAGTAQ